VLVHVGFSDLVRNALVAQGGDQPIEQRGRVGIPNGGSDTGPAIIVADLIDKVGRACETADPVDQSNGVINRGNLLATGSVAMLVLGALSTGCRPGDHGCQIIETSLR
jgi:hypothetical protein